MSKEDRPSISELKESSKRIGPFEVRDLLGRGGMGEVWLARDAMLHRDVAIKVLAADRKLAADAQTRLIKEARAASALDHPNIVTVHQLGHAQGRLFIAMEYVSGRTLSEMIDEGPLRPARVADIIGQVADALGAAHEAGIVHRDVKPDNIIVRDDGRVKVLDFGLVHAAIQPRPESIFPSAPDDEPSGGGAGGPVSIAGPLDETAPIHAYDTQWVLSRTLGGEGTAAAGTPLYMAPEQVEGRDPTPAADQFALAACAFELLTGEPLRSGTTLKQVLDCPVAEALERAAETLPPRALPVLRRALAVEPEDRFESVTEFAAELRRAVSLLSLKPRSLRRPTGRRWPLWLGAVVALAIVLGGVGWLRLGSEPERLRLAIIPGNRVLFGQIYAPLGEHLTRRTGHPVRLVVPQTYGETVDGLVAGRYHMAFLPPKAYIDARRQLPDLVLLGGRYYRGKVEYRSILVARFEEAAQPSLNQLRGKRWCFVDRKSTSGYLVPRSLLVQAGYDVAEDLAQERFLGDHFKVLRAIHAGTCDAGAVSSMQFADGPRQGIPTDDLQVVARSAPLPPIAFVARADLGGPLLEQLQQAVAEADADGSFTRETELSEEMGHFGEVADEDYDVIRDIDGKR